MLVARMPTISTCCQLTPDIVDCGPEHGVLIKGVFTVFPNDMDSLTFRQRLILPNTVNSYPLPLFTSLEQFKGG